MSSSADLDFITRCSSPWEMTQGAAAWLAERCGAPVTAVYLSDGDSGQVRRGLHTPDEDALLPLTSLLPHRLWWKGPAAWTSDGGPSMRIVPFSLGSVSLRSAGGVVVIGPFPLDRSRGRLAVTIDAAVGRLAAPLAAGLERFSSVRPGHSDLLEAVAFQYGAGLDGGPEPILFSLREALLARRVAWEDGRVVVEGAHRSAPAAVAAAEWWLPLVDAARRRQPPAGPAAGQDGGAADDPARRSDAVGVVLSGMADLLDARSPSTRGRSMAVADLAIRLAARLGVDAEGLGAVEEAGCLHRIGLALLGADAEDRPGGTDPSRLAAVGACLLAGAGRPAAVVEAVRGLAERWDGTGPEGRAGAEVPVVSRAVAVAAAWFEILSTWDTPVGRELAERRAARALVARAGADLDPRAVGALLEETDASAAL